MTDKEKILAEIERKIKTLSPFSHQGSDTCGKVVRQLESLIAFINSLPEEPVSEGLDIAIGEYCSNPDNFITYIDVAFAYRSEQKDDIPLIIKAIKFGANWQKQQFEKNRLKHCNSITNEQAELEQGFIDQHLDKYQRMPTFLDAIEYGMNLQKEQIIKRLCNHVNIDKMVEKFEDKYKPKKVLDTEYYKHGIFDTIKAIKED